MKRFLSLISLLLCIVMLAACGGNGGTADKSEAPENSVAASEAPSAEESSAAAAESSEESVAESSEAALTGLWANATYTEDTTFGTGATTVTVEVKAEDVSVDLIVKTDKTNLGDALLEHSLIAGDEGAYGMYIKVVNGMTADYDVDQSYWAFYKNGEMMMTGVDGTEIADGEHYELVYTKG